MNKREIRIGGRNVILYGETGADSWIIQPVDQHDMEGLDNEVSRVGELAEGSDFFLAAFRVNDWNQDLAPWPAPPVFGEEGFGGGAAGTLSYIREELLAGLAAEDPGLAGKPAGQLNKKLYLGGYSLAGFFALWAVYQTDLFCGAAAASPSVWYPDWTEYAQKHPCQAKSVYLSLGDREEKAGPPVMRRVGDAIRKQHELLTEQGTPSVLEWNKGNHFKEPDVRTARGIAWLLRQNR